MKFHTATQGLASVATMFFVAVASMIPSAVEARGEMVKMCLFYKRPSGHARSDPIINQECPSDHVHTFYCPLEFHPNTTYDDLQKVLDKSEMSTSPFVENESLYWHPSIYQIADNGDGTETYTRISNLESSPYYRWDKSVTPLVEAFPPGFRMIAASNVPVADKGGEIGSNMFTECCDLINGEDEDCVSWNGLHFPERSCDFVGIALNMPTCWNGKLGDENDHKDHMAFTTDGTVAGPCPGGYDRRLPQIQLFVRIINYRGDLYRYQLSDGHTDVWHVDFFNGWKEDKLQEIINGCDFYPDQEIDEFNPPCDCTFGDEVEQAFLTPNEKVAQTMCDSDVRKLIVDEATDVVVGPAGTEVLPRGTCKGSTLIPKSWTELTSSLLDVCEQDPGNDGDDDEDNDDEEEEECDEERSSLFFGSCK